MAVRAEGFRIRTMSQKTPFDSFRGWTLPTPRCSVGVRLRLKHWLSSSPVACQEEYWRIFGKRLRGSSLLRFSLLKTGNGSAGEQRKAHWTTEPPTRPKVGRRCLMQQKMDRLSFQTC